MDVAQRGQRALAGLLEGRARRAPLSLVDCTPPVTITQSRMSLEEVTLQLSLICRLDARAEPRGR